MDFRGRSERGRTLIMKAGVDAPLKMSGIWKYAVEVGADASNRVAPQEYNSCPSKTWDESIFLSPNRINII